MGTIKLYLCLSHIGQVLALPDVSSDAQCIPLYYTGSSKSGQHIELSHLVYHSYSHI